MRMLIHGDLHLSSKNRGSHRDYPMFALKRLEEIVELSEKLEVNYIVDLGDLTYGRFHTLEYRKSFESLLTKKREIAQGNGGDSYILKGNHDISTSGMTEYEFYMLKGGFFKEPEDLHFKGLTVFMDGHKVSKDREYKLGDESDDGILLGHNYYAFKDTELPPYGVAKYLDNAKEFKDINMFILGHIHGHHIFRGDINTGDGSKGSVVVYPGSPSIPSYDKDLDMEYKVIIIDADDNSGSVNFSMEIIQLPEIEEVFNLVDIESRKIAKMESSERKERQEKISATVDNLLESESNKLDVDSVLELLPESTLGKKKALELLERARNKA